MSNNNLNGQSCSNCKAEITLLNFFCLFFLFIILVQIISLATFMRDNDNLKSQIQKYQLQTTSQSSNTPVRNSGATKSSSSSSVSTITQPTEATDTSTAKLDTNQNLARTGALNIQ
jgi:hypothetical protein